MYICFVDLEKAFDRVPRRVMQWALRKKGLPEIWVKVVMSLYESSKTKVKVGSEFSERILCGGWCTSGICFYSTAEYCAPVWCRSAHTRLIDSVLNDALRIVTGCLRPISTDHLPVLSGIQPAELRRMGATLSLAYCGSRSYLVWSIKWVLRYSPSETKIQTPVCASCAESFGQP